MVYLLVHASARNVRKQWSCGTFGVAHVGKSKGLTGGLAGAEIFAFFHAKGTSTSALPQGIAEFSAVQTLTLFSWGGRGVCQVRIGI